MTLPLRSALLLLATMFATVASVRAQQGADTAAVTPHPGDRIALKIWNEAEMSDTFNISERGEVILPKLGSVYVADMPIGVLQDSLRRAYAVYLRNPSIDISVLRRVSVLGEVRQPGVYLADLTMGLPEVIARAGGYTDAGNPRNILIVRDGRRIRYGRNGDAELSVAALQSGDQIVVRRKSALTRDPTSALLAAISVVGAFRFTVWPLIQSIMGDGDG